MQTITRRPGRAAAPKRKRQEFYFSLLAAVVCAGLVVLLGNWQMSMSIERQQARNDYITSAIAQLDKQIEEINGLDAQKQRLLARMEIIERLQRSRPEIVHIFDEIVRVLPEGVYLTYLKQSNTRFEIRGVAQSSTRVSTFMRNIDSSEWLSDSALQVLEQNRGNVRGAEFTLFANQRSHATAEGEDASTDDKVAAR
jgi:type IV pilus assembly protein PilN